MILLIRCCRCLCRCCLLVLLLDGRFRRQAVRLFRPWRLVVGWAYGILDHFWGVREMAISNWLFRSRYGLTNTQIWARMQRGLETPTTGAAQSQRSGYWKTFGFVSLSSLLWSLKPSVEP